VEVTLVEVWKHILKVDRVGVRDDFYAVGGDSLASMMLMLEIQARFGTEISIDRFLESPTIDTLARLLERPASAPVSRQAQAAGPPVERITDSILSGVKNRALQLLALYAPGRRTARVWLHRMRGVSIGTNVSIGLSVLMETAYPQLITIGNGVSIGMRTIIIAHLRDSTAHARASQQPTVRIEDNVYIGPGVIVLPNVTIGHGAVVSAGSVVSRSLPPQTFARGNPARPIAHCGVSLGDGSSYEQFLRHLKPIPAGEPTAPDHDAVR
jgi:acetyltransferase-like isoleucine patch superfamily enzyme/acyl carrier protein